MSYGGIELPCGTHRQLRSARVAIIHDWLYVYGGAERVLENILRLFPQADIFCIIENASNSRMGFLEGRKIRTTFIQRIPFAKSHHRIFLPLMPLAIEQLDLSAYDLVISSSYAVAKGVLTGPNQLHVCYCHSPMRYAWDLQHQYLGDSNFGRGAAGFLARLTLHYTRMWDIRSAAGVDAFIANSQFVRRRIHKFYGRQSVVIHPPVDVDTFVTGRQREDFYLAASRLVRYKRIDLVVDAFARLPGRRLVVAGEGPELADLRARATPNVTLLGRHQSAEDLRPLMQKCRAFIFPGIDDFGIVPVEAQACGAPVIAFGHGGVLETVKPFPENQATGLFFLEQTPEALVEAIEQFEALPAFDADACRQNALRFSSQIFRETFLQHVSQLWTSFSHKDDQAEVTASFS